MGPSHTREQKRSQDDAKALLRDRDDRIATLETRLEAYSARASTAQTRLLKTIDVLDALRSQHALEISTEEQAKMKLMHEVNSWRTVANNLEAERDELKDVVEDLIEKEKLSQRRPPERLPTGTLDGSKMQDSCNDDLLAYATSIIARLRTEVEFERQSHRRTVEEANLRIEELEAKVAVREAELEDCVTSLGGYEAQAEEPQDKPTHAFEKQRLSKGLADPKPLSDEECLHFLESNTARNRSLELEICHIAERLEQARMVAGSPSGSPEEPRPSTPQNESEAIPAQDPPMSASVDANTLPHPLDMPGNPPTPLLAPSSTMLSIAQLDNQIRTMTTQMDALVSERTILIESAARQRRVTDGLNIGTFQDVLKVEGECVRLQAEVDDLREQLQHAHAFARDREKALLHEITHLRASLPGAPASHPADDLRHIFSPQPLEENIAAEESMELASPLIPTSVMGPLPGPPCRDMDTEADLVSFPVSPEQVSSVAIDVLPTPPRHIHRNPGPEDIERVQAALDVARTHLARKEEALVQLRAKMEGLRLETVGSTRRDGG